MQTKCAAIMMTFAQWNKYWLCQHTCTIKAGHIKLMEHDILAKHVPCSMMQQSLGKYYVDIATTHKRNSVTHAF